MQILSIIFTVIIFFFFQIVEQDALAESKDVHEKINQSSQSRLEESFFPVGVYVYGNTEQLKELATLRQISLEEWFDSTFKDILYHNCNSVYLANLTSNPDVFKLAVSIANKYNLNIFAQLTGPLYLRPEKGDDYYKNETLKNAEHIVGQYKELDGIVAFMPKEEPTLDEIPMLSDYRKQLRQIDNNHGLYTLHNTIKPFRSDKDNLPDWFGFDRYRFKSMFGDYGVMISTPKDMALRIRTELSDFVSVADGYNRPLIFVIQGYGEDWVGSTEDLLKMTQGVVPEQKSGWKEISAGQWFGWRKYPPPKYGMRLQSWLGILEGTKGLMVYKYRSTGKEIGKRRPALVSENGDASAQWTEFGQTMANLKPLLPLASRWEKVNNNIVETDDPDVFLGTFKDPHANKYYIVVVNSRIATWGEGSERFVTQNSGLQFDSKGLQGLNPAEALVAKLNTNRELQLEDYLSGEQIAVEKGGAFSITIEPGSGRVFEVGGEQFKPDAPKLKLQENS